jgi:intracellular multiplication protein IcmP
MAGKGGGQQENGSNTEAVLFITVVLIALGLWALWTFFRPAVVFPAFVLDAAFMFVIEYTKGIHVGGTAIRDFIHSFFTGGRSAATDISWEQFYYVRSQVGNQVRWIIAPIIFGLAIWVFYRMKGEGYKRVFSLGGGVDKDGKRKPLALAHYQAERWKVATYSAYFDPDIRDTHISPAATPMEFLKNNEVEFENGAFTEDTRETRLPEIFAAQLGKPWTGLKTADLYVQCVGIMCGLHYLRRKSSLGERETLSIAWSQGKDGTEAMKTLVAKYINDKDINKVVDTICNQHAYSNTGLFALLDKARARAGVLASADFAYLKQVDRSLWYTLSNCGRRRFFIEAAGVVSHFFAERVTATKLVEPNVENAINGLEDYLDEQGLLSITEFFKTEDIV